jgi:hypothetical protein
LCVAPKTEDGKEGNNKKTKDQWKDERKIQQMGESMQLIKG